MEENLLSNAMLGVALVLLMAMRDLCKRIAHSDCAIDGAHGLTFKLPTWRAEKEDDSE